MSAAEEVNSLVVSSLTAAEGRGGSSSMPVQVRAGVSATGGKAASMCSTAISVAWSVKQVDRHLLQISACLVSCSKLLLLLLVAVAVVLCGVGAGPLTGHVCYAA